MQIFAEAWSLVSLDLRSLKNFSARTVLFHSSTMLLPCQPSIARLAINIPQWHLLTKVLTLRIGNKKNKNLQKQVKIKFFLPQTWSQLRSMTMNDKAAEHRWSQPCGLDITISACYDWSVTRQSTSLPLRHWNLRNLTLQTCLSITWDFFCLHSNFARLYNAATSPAASHLCSAGLLAIICLIFLWYESRDPYDMAMQQYESPWYIPFQQIYILHSTHQQVSSSTWLPVISLVPGTTG